MPDTISHCLKLTSIDSPSGKEAQIAKYILKWLDKHGYRWKRDPLGSLIASPPRQQPQLFICAHMDTVSQGANIKPTVDNGYLLSDGTTILGADNKASLAAILSAIEWYQHTNHTLPPIELIFTVREETGDGLDRFPFSWIKSPWGIIFDYAEPLGKIILGSPYITNFTLTFSGISAHASLPEKGVNVLLPTAAFISKIPIGRHDANKTTINIGKVTAGTCINSIPASAVIEGEIRSQSRVYFHQHRRNIEALANMLAQQYAVKHELTFGGYCPGYSHSSRNPHLKQLIRILKRLHLNPILETSASVSDANILNAAGFPTITLSDGVENPHTTSERISLKNLDLLTDVIRQCLDDCA